MSWFFMEWFSLRSASIDFLLCQKHSEESDWIFAIFFKKYNIFCNFDSFAKKNKLKFV